MQEKMTVAPIPDLDSVITGLRQMRLKQLADELDACKRFGGDHDAPEGTRFIHMSDTLARSIAAALRSLR